MTTSAIIPSELPLQVFISTVMIREMEQARADAVSAFSKHWFLVPWAFEYTPASSERIDKSYLRKVREAAFVVWLVGQSTTTPVQNEIREALSSNRRLLILLLPTPSRSEQTTALIEEVGTRAKYGKVSDEVPLRDALEAALSDEIIRALKNAPGLGRIERIEEVWRLSRARCIARWEALGVSRTVAVNLSVDSSLGILDDSLLPSDDRPVTVILGSMGSGKSLAAERYHQSAITEFRLNSASPIPIFVEARSLDVPLTEVIVNSSNGLGNPRIQGATVVVDGLDEGDLRRYAHIVNESRLLANTWPHTRILLTGRRISEVTSNQDEQVDMAGLSDAELISLVSRVAGREITEIEVSGWRDSLATAIRAPLFAILLGTYLADRVSAHRNISPYGLLSHFIQRTIETTTTNTANVSRLLRRLAALSTDRGNAAVPSPEVGSAEEILELVNSRLVVESHGRLSFPLVILTEWFAAQSLGEGYPKAEEFVRDPLRIERWLFPISMFVAMFSHEAVTRVLKPIVINYPGLAGRIVHEALSNHELFGAALLPDSSECGRRIREAFQAWIDGMGALGTAMGLADETGHVRPIGVLAGPRGLVVAVYSPDQRQDEITVLPATASFPFDDLAPTPGRLRWRGAQGGAAWAWEWTFSDIVGVLNKRVENCSLALYEGPLAQENAWRAVVRMRGLSDLYSEPIALVDVENNLALLADVDVLRDRTGHDHDLNVLRNEVRRLRKSHQTSISSPWPGPNRTREEARGFIPRRYSNDQFLARLIAVYEGALQGYQDLVVTWFPKFASHLELMNMMPVRLIGQLRFVAEAENRPSMEWYFEKAPAGSRNSVHITLKDSQDKSFLSQSDNITGGGMMDIYKSRPAARLAFEWLAKDLNRLGWVERLGPRIYVD